MKKYGWMTAALLLAVVGCQRREMMYLGDDVAPIHFSVAYQDAEVSAETGSSQAPQTKALVNLDKGITVRVLAYKRRMSGASPATTIDPTNDTFVAECTYVADGSGNLTPCAVKADGTVDAAGTVPEAISLNNGTYDFYAYSPALPVTKGMNSNPYLVSGITNGMDFLGSVVKDRSVSKAASTVALVFEHKCSKITFNVKQPDGADVTKLKVDSIVLRKLNTAANVDPWWINKDLTVSIGTDKDTALFKTFGGLNNTDTPAKLIGRTGFGVVLPKQNDASPVPVNIYLTLGDSAYLFKTEFPATEYVKGKNYTYNMIFKQTAVEFTFDVVSWNEVAVDFSGGMGADNGGVLVGSWYQYTSSDNLGDDNVNGGIGAWQPVSPTWTIGNAMGTQPGGGVGGWGDVNAGQQPGGGTGTQPGGGVGGWGDVNAGQQPGGGTGTQPGGGVGGWGDVNDNQPGVGA